MAGGQWAGGLVLSPAYPVLRRWVADGWWPMANGRRRMANGRWPATDQWTVAGGRWPVVCGHRAVVGLAVGHGPVVLSNGNGWPHFDSTSLQGLMGHVSTNPAYGWIRQLQSSLCFALPRHDCNAPHNRKPILRNTETPRAGSDNLYKP